MVHVPRLLLTLVPLLFSLLAFIFTLLAITSNAWAIRPQYSDQTNLYSQKTAIYALSRSPFKICTYVADTPPALAVSSTPDSEDQPPPPQVDPKYHKTCQSFRPSGLGKTSCELAVVTQNANLSKTGDRRQCQQIHLAGNFGITSSLFLSLAFLLTVSLMAVDLTSYKDSPTAPIEHEEADQIVDAKTKPIHHHHSKNNGTAAISPTPGPNPTSTRNSSPTTQIFPYISLTTLAFLAIGVIAALLSQYYAVLGLVQSAPNNGDYIDSTGNAEHHDPWIQGRALGAYMTLSWSFAVAAAFTLKLTWPTANWRT